ncbi:hypothetical protein [Kouleothrix sp.]|uniref:hypothetical protein n=1 Tax=Kouleothrix sp. TaxID=2779161 RepID=UPI00391A8434
MTLVLIAANLLLAAGLSHAHQLLLLLSDPHLLGLWLAHLASAPLMPPLDGVPATLAAKIDAVVGSLEAIGRPIAILGVALLALSWLAAGVLPEWAQQNKGVLVKMLMGGILLGIAPDIVGLVISTPPVK